MRTVVVIVVIAPEICNEYIKTTPTADLICVLYQSFGKLRRFSQKKLDSFQI